MTTKLLNVNFTIIFLRWGDDLFVVDIRWLHRGKLCYHGYETEMTKKIHARSGQFTSYNGRTHFLTLCRTVAKSESKAATIGARVTCKDCIRLLNQLGRIPDSWKIFVKPEDNG